VVPVPVELPNVKRLTVADARDVILEKRLGTFFEADPAVDWWVALALLGRLPSGLLPCGSLSFV